jgi:hypothetical protein
MQIDALAAAVWLAAIAKQGNMQGLFQGLF